MKRTDTEVEILGDWLLLHPLFRHLTDRSQLDFVSHSVTGLVIPAESRAILEPDALYVVLAGEVKRPKLIDNKPSRRTTEYDVIGFGDVVYQPAWWPEFSKGLGALL